MGGCRCTYRSCSVKSDGQTHMFHYPVFDKVRCHQWLANAQRLDFLNLKVSQLKNRVVCQHHFENDAFMNFKKDKLKFEAIPTRNGPYCDPISDLELPEEAVPIALEDIENERLGCGEKKANFSVKYSDFLTNSCDLIEPITLNIEGDIPAAMQKHNTLLNDSIPTVIQNKQYKPPVEVLYNSKNQTQPLLIVSPFSREGNAISVATKDNIQYDIDINKKPEPTSTGGQGSSNVTQISKEVNNQGTKSKNNKIKIISEKKISTPLSFTGKLEPVSPSSVIFPRPRNKQIVFTDKENIKSENDVKIEYIDALDGDVKTFTKQIEQAPFIIKDNNGVEIELIPVNVNNSYPHVQETDSLNMVNLQNHQQNISLLGDQSYGNQLVQTEQQFLPIDSQYSQNNNPSYQSTLNNNPSKNKIPPERVAAIEEKRKFNKKLRDMIEFCLDDLEDHKVNENKCAGKNLIENNMQTRLLHDSVESKKSILKSSVLNPKPKKDMQTNLRDSEVLSKSVASDVKSQTVKNFLSKESNLPDVSEYNMSMIEARIQRMEDTLLRKIEQNTKKISELKDTLVSPTTGKKSALTQTNTKDEKLYKKQLFQEISQFLSPDANSLIYEELFINMYTKDINATSKQNTSNDVILAPKRRRRR